MFPSLPFVSMVYIFISHFILYCLVHKIFYNKSLFRPRFLQWQLDKFQIGIKLFQYEFDAHISKWYRVTHKMKTNETY